MKTAQEMYPDAVENDGYWYGVYDYQPMVESFGKVLHQKSDGSYQGDTWVLYEDGDKIGLLEFGWGSCSGCDSLQACSNYQDVESLAKSLSDSIKWFDSRKEALDYFINHDWEGDWAWHCGVEDFVKTAKELLAV